MNEIKFWKGISLALAIAVIISIYNTEMSMNNTDKAISLVYEYKNLSEESIKYSYELRQNLSDLKWKLYLAEKHIPSYIKYLNNTNNYSSCWKTENGTKYIRKSDCYNCENFTNDYIDYIKKEYEVYYVSGKIEGHEFSHGFAKVCRYINPTNNEVMSKEQFERYKINYEELR